MTSNFHKKTEEKKPKTRKIRRLWIYKKKVISVDDQFVTYQEDGEINRMPIDHKLLRTPEYRKWLIDQGFWIPSMDLKELTITIDPHEVEVEGPAETKQEENLNERMKRLKAQQKEKFKKYYERKAEQAKKSKDNTKSGVSKYKRVVEMVGNEKAVRLRRVRERDGIEEPEKPTKVDPLKVEDPKVPKKPEEPPKETVRSHYCYTEMHLASGKEVKRKF